MNRINKLLRLSLIICSLFGTITAQGATADGRAYTPIAGEVAAGLEESLAELRADLDERWSGTYGTWSGERISAASAALRRELLLRVLEAPDAAAASRLQTAAVSYLQLLDPVWGGAFEAVELTSTPTVRRSRVVDGSKLAASQAQALEVLAWAWVRSGEVRFRNGLEKVDAYLQDWLAAPGGGYFAAQLGEPAELPAQLDAARYWALRTEHERRRFGLPPLLREVQRSDLALLATAYLSAHAATGDPNYLRVAERLGRLLKSSADAADTGSAAAAAGLREALTLLLLHEVSLAEDWWTAALNAAGRALAAAADAQPLMGPAEEALALQLRWRLLAHGETSTAGPAAPDRLLAALAAAANRVTTVELAQAAEAVTLWRAAALEARLYGETEDPAYRALLNAAATGLADPRRVIVHGRTSAPARLELCRRQSCSAAIASAEAFAAAAEGFLGAQP